MESGDNKGKIKVVQFFRKARIGYNFSIEFIFEEVRNQLIDRVDFEVVEMPFLSNGLFRRIYNVFYAFFYQGPVNHITGDIHYINLLFARKSTILTIHDCGPMQHGSKFQKAVFKWLWLKIPVWKSMYITTVSEYSKSDILMYTNCPPDKVKVVPVCVSSIFKPSTRIFNVNCPVILQIGSAENKNIARLIEAISTIRCHLVIIGRLEESKERMLRQFNISYENKYDLSTEEVFKEYQNCDIVSFVSTLEGFGMPIVEANWVERVVIAGSNSSMPEVAGGSALLVDAYSIDEIRKGIFKLIRNPELRESLLAKGRQNRDRFLTKNVAEQYLEVYESIGRISN